MLQAVEPRPPAIPWNSGLAEAAFCPAVVLKTYNWEWERLKASVTTLPIPPKRNSPDVTPLKRVLKHCDKYAELLSLHSWGFCPGWGWGRAQLSLRELGEGLSSCHCLGGRVSPEWVAGLEAEQLHRLSSVRPARMCPTEKKKKILSLSFFFFFLLLLLRVQAIRQYSSL